jgi:hypothetical protein
VLGTGEGLDLMFDIGLGEKRSEVAGNVRRNAAVGLGEGVIELALDLIEEQMR